MIEAKQLKPGVKRTKRPEGNGTALANFLIDQLEEKDGSASKIKNDEVATYLGYARPNIVSGWKSGRTKFTLENVLPMADFLGVDPAYMMALYVEQYNSSGEDIDRFPELVRMLGHVVTDDEWEIVNFIRQTRRGNPPKLTDDVKRQLETAFATSPEEGIGPYWPIKQIVPTEGTQTRTSIRRGKPRDFTVTELEVMEAEKAASAQESQVVKKSAAAKV